jgi:hypothetical protein
MNKLRPMDKIKLNVGSPLKPIYEEWEVIEVKEPYSGTEYWVRREVNSRRIEYRTYRHEWLEWANAGMPMFGISSPVPEVEVARRKKCS